MVLSTTSSAVLASPQGGYYGILWPFPSALRPAGDKNWVWLHLVVLVQQNGWDGAKKNPFTDDTHPPKHFFGQGLYLASCLFSLLQQASRAQILDKATEYIQYMRRKNHTHQQDIDDLKRQNALLEQQGQHLGGPTGAGRQLEMVPGQLRGSYRGWEGPTEPGRDPTGAGKGPMRARNGPREAEGVLWELEMVPRS